MVEVIVISNATVRGSSLSSILSANAVEMIGDANTHTAANDATTEAIVENENVTF
jgi:hypothetical protein